MTMNASQLAADMADAMQAVIATLPTNSPMTSEHVRALAGASAGAIIDHIKNNATITTPAGPGSIA